MKYFGRYYCHEVKQSKILFLDFCNFIHKSYDEGKYVAISGIFHQINFSHQISQFVYDSHGIDSIKHGHQALCTTYMCHFVCSDALSKDAKSVTNKVSLAHVKYP